MSNTVPAKPPEAARAPLLFHSDTPFRSYVRLSRAIYNPRRLKEYRRMLMFVLRALSHHRQMKDLGRFFEADPLRARIAAAHPCVFEQATRHWFFARSTFRERHGLLQDHFRFTGERFGEAAVREIYLGPGLNLWSDIYEDQPLALELGFQAGRKKEGLLALVLKLGARNLYQVHFWFGADASGEVCLWIGALQGSPGGRDLVRDLTKHFFGYRPKNLMVFTARSLGRELGVPKVYAVSDRGHYARSHLRLKKKLKTPPDEFWQETGGRLMADARFFELPLTEPRKSPEEVEPRKRSLYRKRFAWLDALELQVAARFRELRRVRAVG